LLFCYDTNVANDHEVDAVGTRQLHWPNAQLIWWQMQAIKAPRKYKIYFSDFSGVMSLPQKSADQ
jgi:hypothetical protein